MGRRTISMRPEAGHAVKMLGYLVHQVRVGHRWTLEDLAARAGVSARTVSQIEAGAASVSIGNALNVAAVCNIPLFGAQDVEVGRLMLRTLELKSSLLPQSVRPTDDDDDVDRDF